MQCAALHALAEGTASHLRSHEEVCCHNLKSDSGDSRCNTWFVPCLSGFCLLSSRSPVLDHIVSIRTAACDMWAKRMQTGNSRGAAAHLSKGGFKLSAVPHSDVLIVTTSEQAVLLPWTAGNAAYPSRVTLPAACVQQCLSRAGIHDLHTPKHYSFSCSELFQTV